MPIHEFKCAGCDEIFEELVRSTRDMSDVRCPHCGSEDAQRQLSVFAARSNAAKPAPLPAGGCGRCGDPAGPCSMG